MVGQQALLAVIPFGEWDAFTLRNVVVFGVGQIQIKFDFAGAGFAVTCHGDHVHVFSSAGGIVVVVIVGGAVNGGVFCP